MFTARGGAVKVKLIATLEIKTRIEELYFLNKVELSVKYYSRDSRRL